MAEPTTLALRRDGAVLHVTLNRPEVRNAMSLAMVRELIEVVKAAEQDGETRVVVLRGAGGHFCAGADLKDMAGARARLTEDPDAVMKVNAAFGELCIAYAGASLAVIAVLEGTVMGGGFGLACVTDVAIAAENTVFRLPETSLGVLPAQIAPFLVERLGYAEAKRLAVTGSRIGAAEALQIRLVHEVHAGRCPRRGACQGRRRHIALRAWRARRDESPGVACTLGAAGLARTGCGPGVLARGARTGGGRRHDGVPAEAQGELDATMSFRKILVANRGEIACRVMRTARTLGYRTVAVYSDADAAAPHVALADEAVRIGASPAAESYLKIDRVLEAARVTGADAVHPGYGFLSERADFAQACADAGLVFIGPPASAITAMGDKAGAKRRMIDAGVPCAPGYLGEDQDDAQARGGGRAPRSPAAGQGRRGRRRSRHAARAFARGTALGARRRPSRGPERFWRRHADARATDRGRKAHRNPGLRRSPRQCDPPRGARLHRAASPAEGHRGGALARRQPGHARAHGSRCRSCSTGRRLRGRRHGRVHRRCRPEALLPRNEYPAAGRAPGHRVHHRARPRRVAVARGGRRTVAARTGRGAIPGPRHRSATVRGGPVHRVRAADRTRAALAAGRRAAPGRADRFRHHRGWPGHAVLRRDGRQADRARPRPHRRDPASHRGDRGRAARGPQQQRPLPARPAGPSRVPRGADAYHADR